MIDSQDPWLVGEIRNGSDPVLIRHRLAIATNIDSEHEWIAVMTHYLSNVQSNGLPEAEYNNSLQTLDLDIINALEKGRGDRVVLVETCHGKRSYYAYVRGFESVGKRMHSLIEQNPTQRFSFRTALDPERKFVTRYLQLLK